MAMEVVDVKAMASFETLGGGGVTVPVDVVTNILNQVTYHTEQPKVASDWSSCLGCVVVVCPCVASDWSSCLGCVVVVCPCVGHLSCLPYEHYLKRLIYASATY
uniref:Uncharacterized protein n=1 Tax=Helianthus annuus TaxID=4232 RepID=A0A251SDY1_HELAN